MVRLGNKLRLTSRHVTKFLPENVAPCRQLEEVEQQLEVADKQLRSTRAFLEEQAVEREQEREEWDRRLALASLSRRSSKSLSRGNTGL